MPNFLKQNIKNKFLLFHLIISALLFFSLNPLFGGDTGSYTAIAKLMSEGTLSGYDWARTPGYPIVCLLFSLLSSSGPINIFPELLTAQLICITQFFFLLFSIYFLYDVVIKKTRFKYPQLVFFIFSPVLVIYTRYILPDSLSISVMILISAYFLLRDDKKIAILAALLILLKPNFLPFSIIISIYISFKNKKYLFKYLLIMYLTICSLNYLNTNNFSLTNITGFSLSQPVYNLFSKVHLEDKIIGEILENEYQLELSNNSLRADTWTRSTQKMYPLVAKMPYKKSREEWKHGTSDLSDYIGKVSKYLIIENYTVVLKNSLLAFSKTFDYRLPVQIAGVNDPKSIDGIPAIKIPLFFKKLYIPLETLNHIFLNFFEIACIFFLVYKTIKSQDKFYLMLLSIILTNKIMLSFFGAFDTRYNFVILPLLPTAFFYLTLTKEKSKV
jgi:hypothetical protein